MLTDCSYSFIGDQSFTTYRSWYLLACQIRNDFASLIMSIENLDVVIWIIIMT